MPPKRKCTLKQSVESRTARGLPSNLKKKSSLITESEKVEKLTKNTAKDIERLSDPPHYKYLYSSNSEVDKITSMNNGLDRCSSLLNAMLSSPRDSHETILPQKKLKKTVKIISPNVKTAKTKPTKPSFNKRLLSSTPAFNDAVQIPNGQAVHKATIVVPPSCQNMLSEKNLLINYWQEIQNKKHQIESIYEEILQETMFPIDKNSDATRDKTYEGPNVTKETVSLSSLMKSITEKLSLNKDKEPNKMTNICANIKDQCPSSIVKLHSVESSPVDILSQIKLQNKDCITNSHTVNFKQVNATDCNTPESKSDGIYSPLSTSTTVTNICSPEKKKKSFNFQPPAVSNHSQSLIITQLPVYNVNTAETSSLSQLTTLNYLFKELRTLIHNKSGDLELSQLLEEIDHIVGLLPFLMTNSSNSVSDANNDFNLQSLKSENADLKRSLRNVKCEIEKLKSQLSEKMLNHNKKDDVDELQAKILREEEIRLRLSSQVQEVIMVAEELRKENENLRQHISTKENQLNEERHAWLIERSKLLQEHEEKQGLIEECESRNKSFEESINILQISIKQRDIEIKRLEKLTRDLQQSVTNLLNDISQERNKKATNNPLTKKPVFAYKQSENFFSRVVHSPIYQFKPPFDLNESSNNSTLAHSSIDSDINLSSVEVSSNPSTLRCSRLNSADHETDSWMSTLRTCDSSEFQKDLKNLDEEILKIQKSLTKAAAQ